MPKGQGYKHSGTAYGKLPKVREWTGADGQTYAEVTNLYGSGNTKPKKSGNSKRGY